MTDQAVATRQVFRNNSAEPGEFGVDDAQLLMTTVDTEQFTTDFLHYR